MASYPWPGLRWQCSSSMHPWGTQHSRRGARAWTDRPAVSLGVNKFGQGLFVVVLKLLRLEVGRLLGDDEAFTTVSLEFHKTRPAREFMTRMGDQPASVLPATSAARFAAVFKAVRDRYNRLKANERGPIHPDAPPLCLARPTMLSVSDSATTADPNAGLAPPTYAPDFPIKRDVVGMARRPTAVDVRWRVLRSVAFIAMMRCLPGKDRRGSQNHDQDRN